MFKGGIQMADMWRCPECETMNNEDKCVICGCSRPQSVSHANKSNVIQEQLKINMTNQGTLKNNQNYTRDKNQYQNKSDIQQGYTGSIKKSAVRRKKSNKKIPIIIISCICLIIGGIYLGFRNNYEDIVKKSEAASPSLTTVSTIDYKLNVTSAANQNSITTAPISEKETTTTTAVPKTVTETITETDMVIMPSLMNKDYSTAIKILDTIGMQYKVSYSDKKYVDIDENCVYSQKPATGKKVSRDTVVEIGISTYAPKTTQPPAAMSVDTTTPTTTTSVTTTTTAKTTTTASSASEYKKEWNETEINETLYIKSECYSRASAVVGSEAVKKYEAGTKINVVAATDTGYYKLKDGSFIHSDYVTDQKPETETVTKSSPITEPSTNTEARTLPKTYDESLNLNGDVTIFSSFSSYFINNFPIEGTTWDDYYWSSNNEACVQIVSGMLVTYFEGDATITLIYIDDPSIVATAKVRVVS